MIRAIRFLRSFQAKLKTKASPGESISIPEAQFNIQVFTPSREARSILVFIHGIHPNGPYDPRFLAFARTCAETGFLVLAPDISLFRKFKISFETKDQLVELVRAIPKYFNGNAVNNIGMLAISYGAGPALLAAAELETVQYLVSIGGYYNLNHAVDFLITGRHEAGTSRTPQWWGRMIFAMHHVDVLAPKEDRVLLGEILLSRLSLQEAEDKEARLTTEGKQFLNNLLTGLSSELETTFLRAADEHRQLFASMSPEFMLHRLNRNLRIYLLHGRTDSLIPFEETLELASKLKELGFGNVRSLTTASLTHVDLEMSKALLEGVQLLTWTQAVLNEARSHVTV